MSFLSAILYLTKDWNINKTIASSGYLVMGKSQLRKFLLVMNTGNE